MYCTVEIQILEKGRCNSRSTIQILNTSKIMGRRPSDRQERNKSKHLEEAK